MATPLTQLLVTAGILGLALPATLTIPCAHAATTHAAQPGKPKASDTLSPNTPQNRGIAPGGCVVVQSVDVTEAWIRQPPPGARMLAGYLAFKNPAKTAIALTGASCDAFEEVQIHTIARDAASGMVRMVRLNELVIPAGQSLVMAPGHDHLMLIGPKRNLNAGDTVDLTLTFDHGAPQTVTAKVRGRS